MELYSSSHLFLHPSETPPDQNQEGIPNSVLEAMSTGLAVAATRHGGIPEAVEHGRTGFLVSERDFEALAAAMKEIVRSAHTFREMGQLGSEHVAAHFEQGAQVRSLESHYDEAVALAGAAVPARAAQPTPAPARFAEHVPAK
jgi:glycosyltransferase involved in cell wall biosynthesis